VRIYEAWVDFQPMIATKHSSDQRLAQHYRHESGKKST
jgi:hypothetical protein